MVWGSVYNVIFESAQIITFVSVPSPTPPTMSSAPGSAKPKSTTTSSSSKPMGLSSNSPPAGPGEEGEDEDDVRLDVAFIQGFARCASSPKLC